MIEAPGQPGARSPAISASHERFECVGPVGKSELDDPVDGFPVRVARFLDLHNVRAEHAERLAAEAYAGDGSADRFGGVGPTQDRPLDMPSIAAYERFMAACRPSRKPTTWPLNTPLCIQETHPLGAK